MSEISAYRDGVQFEHERIIKLLENEYALAVRFDLEIIQGLGVAIELLKGENK